MISSQNKSDNIHLDKYHSERIFKISHVRDIILARVTMNPGLGTCRRLVTWCYRLITYPLKCVTEVAPQSTRMCKEPERKTDVSREKTKEPERRIDRAFTRSNRL